MLYQQVDNTSPYLRSLKLDGTLCCLGIPKEMEFSPVLLTMGRRRLASSGVGGTIETQEMLDFCSQHNISANVEIIAAADINDGFKRLERGEVRYRLSAHSVKMECWLNMSCCPSSASCVPPPA